jgi:arginine deiminase
MSTLHPAASLYEGVTEEKAISQCYDNLKKIFRNNGVYVETVESALARNRTRLEEIAFKSLTYEKVEDKNDKTLYNDLAKKQFSYYLSEEYKKSIIQSLTDDQLLDVVFTQPKMKLKITNTNTFCEYESQSFNPVGNLVFCRDQQITTKKGVVIGKLKSSQRALENDIMNSVYNNLNANVIGRIPEGNYLEGGDFFVAKPDLSMCGVGLRTTVGGVNYLMEKDLLGTDRFAVVYDDEDLDQQRMHLDTYFNILSPKHVIALDFDQCGKLTGKNIHRKVYLYSKKKRSK